MNPEPPPALVTVRTNRTHGAWLLVIGATVLFIVLIQDVFFDPYRALAYALPYVFAGLLMYEGTGLLVRTVYFTYDPASEQLVVRSGWGRPRAYPRPGYEWIAYSTGPLRVREVAADGRSRTIPVRPTVPTPRTGGSSSITFTTSALLTPSKRPRTGLMSSKPKPMWITDDVAWCRVGFNRRRLASMMIVGTLAAPAGFAAVAYGAKPEFYFLGFMTLAVLPAMIALLGFFFHLEGTYFRYECHGFALKGIHPWGTNIIRRWRSEGIDPWHPDKETSYPERGFDRLEFSVANASVYQVRPDGSRERLWMRPGWADPADWEAFIAHLRRIGALEQSR